MKVLSTLTLMFVAAVSFAQTSERSIVTSIDINAPVDTVWTRWTTPQGIKRFFAAEPHIELQTLGRLDFYFNPSAPEGQRGAENNRVLAWQQNQMLSFTWDAPPNFPEIRKQRTVVIIRFTELPGKKTNVTLTQTGWGSGKDWDTVFGYFGKAWSEFVLPNLKYSCENPAANLSNIPKGLPAAKKL
ncbi:MAG TPA: SRPBCC domain-containing protein [Cyclobacteriaceae bacterium]|nr:SRPBCC domain-containing protein [Cyclobacteriaceae bacterium]